MLVQIINYVIIAGGNLKCRLGLVTIPTAGLLNKN